MLSSEIFVTHGYLQLMIIEADAGMPLSKANKPNPISSSSRYSVNGEGKRGEASFLVPPNPSSRQFYARASLKDCGSSENLHTFTTGLHHYTPQHKIMEEFLFRRVSSTQEIHVSLHSLEDSTSVQSVVIPVSRLAEGVQFSQWYQLFLVDDTTTTNGHEKTIESPSPGSSIKLQIQFTIESEYQPYQSMSAELSTRTTTHSEEEEDKDDTCHGREDVPSSINAMEKEKSIEHDKIDPPKIPLPSPPPSSSSSSSSSSLPPPLPPNFDWRANELLTVGIIDYLLVFGPNYTTQSPSTPSSSIPWSPSPFVESEITLWDRFPTEDHEQLPLPPKIEYFACPEGSKVILAKKRPKPTLSSFILSGNDADNNQQLGACLVVYMKLPYNNPPVLDGDIDDHDADTRIMVGPPSDISFGKEIGIEVDSSMGMDGEGKREEKKGHSRRGLGERNKAGEESNYDRTGTKMGIPLGVDTITMNDQTEQESCNQTPFMGEPRWRRTRSDSDSGRNSPMTDRRRNPIRKDRGRFVCYGDNDDNNEDLRTAGKESMSQRWNWTAVTVCVVSRWPFVRQLQQCLLTTYHHNIYRTLEKWEKYYTLSTCCSVVSGYHSDYKPLRLSGLFGGLFASLCMECPLPRCGAFTVTIGIESPSQATSPALPLQSSSLQQQSQQQAIPTIPPFASATSSSTTTTVRTTAFAAKIPTWNPFSHTGQPPSKHTHSSINFTLPSQEDLPVCPYNIYASLLQRLGCRGTLLVLGAALRESRILLLSKDLSLLPAVCESLRALLYPLKWIHVFLPVVPAPLLDLVQAPVPYLLGTHTDWLHLIPWESLQDVLVVDCDTGDIDVGGPSKAGGGSVSGRKGSSDKGGKDKDNTTSVRSHGRGSVGKASGGGAGGDGENGRFSGRSGGSKASGVGGGGGSVGGEGGGVGDAFERGDTFGGLVLRFPSSMDRWLLMRLREIRKMSEISSTTTTAAASTTTAATTATATTISCLTNVITDPPSSTIHINPPGSPHIKIDPGKDTAIQLVIFDALLNLLRFVPGCLFALHGGNEVFNRPLFLSECCRTMEERMFMTVLTETNAFQQLTSTISTSPSLSFFRRAWCLLPPLIEIAVSEEPPLRTHRRRQGAPFSSEYSDSLSAKYPEPHGQNIAVGQHVPVGQNVSVGENVSVVSHTPLGQGLDVSSSGNRGNRGSLSKDHDSLWLLTLDTISEDGYFDHEMNDGFDGGNGSKSIVVPHHAIPLPSPVVKFPQHTSSLNLDGNVIAHSFYHTPRGGRAKRTGSGGGGGGGGLGGGYVSGRSSLSSSPYLPQRSMTTYPSPVEGISVRGMLSRSTSASFDHDRGLVTTTHTTTSTPSIGSSSLAIRSLTSQQSRHPSALPSPLEPHSLEVSTISGHAVSVNHISRFSFENDRYAGPEESSGAWKDLSLHLPSHPDPHPRNARSLSQPSHPDRHSNLSNKGKNDDNEANNQSHLLPCPTLPLHDQIIALIEKYQPLFVCHRNSIDPLYGAIITNGDPILIIPIIDTTTTTSTPTTSNPPSRTPSRSGSIEYTWAASATSSGASGDVISAFGTSDGSTGRSGEMSSYGGNGSSFGINGTSSVGEDGVGEGGVSGGGVSGGGAGSSLRPEGHPRLSSIILTPGVTPGTQMAR